MLYPRSMKALPIAALVLTLGGGVASADRFGGHVGGHVSGGGRVVAHESFHGGFGGHGPVVARGGGYYHGGYYGHGYGYRAPIYVGHPFIRDHYYNYGYRPELIVEDYPARDGYAWVRGSWGWNGAEWIWSPGYYEPVY
jgi:hypothetical protein